MTEPAEIQRRKQRDAGECNWDLWGTYLSERQWGTVREDYSHNGDAWNHFPFDHSHQRTYRWGEDGLLGLCDEQGLICFAMALWNGEDAILKERLFGLSNPEGNHGEDLKDYMFHLAGTPTGSYAKALYKYPQRAFPYETLRKENRQRDRSQPEFELIDTGIFAEDRYFDVVIEYAKADPEDILIRVTATNRGRQRSTYCPNSGCGTPGAGAQKVSRNTTCIPVKGALSHHLSLPCLRTNSAARTTLTSGSQTMKPIPNRCTTSLCNPRTSRTLFTDISLTATRLPSILNKSAARAHSISSN